MTTDKTLAHLARAAAALGTALRSMQAAGMDLPDDTLADDLGDVLSAMDRAGYDWESDLETVGRCGTATAAEAMDIIAAAARRAAEGQSRAWICADASGIRAVIHAVDETTAAQRYVAEGYWPDEALGPIDVLVWPEGCSDDDICSECVNVSVPFVSERSVPE